MPARSSLPSEGPNGGGPTGSVTSGLRVWQEVQMRAAQTAQQVSQQPTVLLTSFLIGSVLIGSPAFTLTPFDHDKARCHHIMRSPNSRTLKSRLEIVDVQEWGSALCDDTEFCHRQM